MIFFGNTASIRLDKACTEKSSAEKIVFVFEDEQGCRNAGWFYGKGITPAKFRLIAGHKYEVMYSF